MLEEETVILCTHWKIEVQCASVFENGQRSVHQKNVINSNSM